MQAPTILNHPVEFKTFAQPIKSQPVYRGVSSPTIPATNQTGIEALLIGSITDIQNVKSYTFKEGTLAFELKPGIVFARFGGTINDESSKPAIATTDAILNQLAITIFETITQDGEIKTIGLLNGNRNLNPRLIYADGLGFYRMHYDDASSADKAIDFGAIDDFAFDPHSFTQTRDGSQLSIRLKKEYIDNPAVIYAIHRVFGATCGLTLSLV